MEKYESAYQMYVVARGLAVQSKGDIDMDKVQLADSLCLEAKSKLESAKLESAKKE